MAQLAPLARLRNPKSAASASSLWREIALVAIFYCAYTLVRLLIPHDESGAFAHAEQILSLERTLGLDVELDLNHTLLQSAGLAKLANYYYATAHFAITLGILVWLYRRHPGHYRWLRTSLMAATGVALIGFWVYPLAPPRFLGGHGFVDPVTAFHSFGLYSSPSAGALTNQFAAMPSMHAGWALWCAVAVMVVSKRLWLRTIGALYPIVTIFVIFATANHYVLDAVVGVTVTTSALAAAYLTRRNKRAVPPPSSGAVPDTTTIRDSLRCSF